MIRFKMALVGFGLVMLMFFFGARRSAKAASARRPIVRRSSRSASSWVRQARRRTLVARKAEVREDAPDDAGILDRGDQAHAAATVRTGEDVHRKDPLEQLRPAPAPRRRSA